ncbi:restriction endonuclease subunit S [Legionella pneumophila serogroup 1]
MSNKNKEKNTALKQCVQPKLRFPEFQNLEGWINDTLGSLYTFITTNCYSRDKLNYKSGIVRNIHYGDIHKKFNALFDIKKEIVPFVNETENIEKLKSDSYCIKGDIIFADASENMDDVGKSIEIVNLHNEKLLAGLHTILARPKGQKFIVGFGGYLFQSEMIRTQIKKQSQGTKVFGISASRLATIEIFYPLEKEQQKIADCLSSIDELITAESKKLDALKIYKKGLMQQLFPAEGETLPKLRFPEFQAAPEWDKKAFDQLIEIIDGDRGVNYPKSEELKDVGYCLFLNAKNVTKFGFKFNEMQFIDKEKDDALRKGKLHRADIVLTTRGSVGQFAFFSDEIPFENMRINSGMVILRIKSKKIDPHYLYYFCKSEFLEIYIKNIAFGNAQQQLTVAEMKKFHLCYPDIAEQEKITRTLSSIDTLITNQSKKMDTLKKHKNGLMQQLFPIMCELKK